jgi:hypothetical protein
VWRPPVAVVAVVAVAHIFVFWLPSLHVLWFFVSLG